MERKWHGKQILNNCKSAHDPLGACIVDRETAAYRKVILESQIEKEKEIDLQASINGNNEMNGEQITC